MRPKLRSTLAIAAVSISLSVAFSPSRARANGGGHHGSGGHQAGGSSSVTTLAGPSTSSSHHYAGSGISISRRSYLETGARMPYYYLHPSPPIIAEDLPAARLHRFLGEKLSHFHVGHARS